MRTPNYDKHPVVEVPEPWREECWVGGENVCGRLRAAVAGGPGAPRTVLAVECYVGVFDEAVRHQLGKALDAVLIIDTKDAFRTPAEIDALIAPDLGGEDPVFGVMSRLTLPQFLDEQKTEVLRRRIEAASGVVIVAGPGAILVAPDPDVLVYADMPRREGQLRQRRNEVANLGADNHEEQASLQYKRSFFIDWRVCDRLKRDTMGRWDFLLDTTTPQEPKLITGAAHREALRQVVSRPFRVVPFFDPGPWGGQWMKEVCDLDRTQKNFAWCFDCVPEENSLRLEFAAGRVEIPAQNVVMAQAPALLGEAVYGRFGPEFPIRFDFLDTMGGGNLSFQVHPPTEFIREHFGLPYTQDESYYLLEAGEGAEVYLGRKNGAQFSEMMEALEEAQAGGPAFEADRFAAKWPARKHDHFLIPAGTLHCSGAESMVLEISATPYIFTFKLWDWNRLGLDGKPRPVNLERGRQVIDWSRDEDSVREELINRVTLVVEGEGWREERTGLHAREFIETRRHWFTGPVDHHTGGGVNVLNLVQGEEAVVESPDGAFASFVVHYAETFIVPAAVGAYRIRPLQSGECATLKAFVRG